MSVLGSTPRLCRCASSKRTRSMSCAHPGHSNSLGQSSVNLTHSSNVYALEPVLACSSCSRQEMCQLSPHQQQEPTLPSLSLLRGPYGLLGSFFMEPDFMQHQVPHDIAIHCGYTGGLKTGRSRHTIS